MPLRGAVLIEPDLIEIPVLDGRGWMIMISQTCSYVKNENVGTHWRPQMDDKCGGRGGEIPEDDRRDMTRS